MAVTDHGTMSCTPSIAATKAPSLWQMLTLWRTRAQLKTLEADQLRDIGVSAEAARREAKRPVWDVPANWRS